MMRSCYIYEGVSLWFFFYLQGLARKVLCKQMRKKCSHKNVWKNLVGEFSEILKKEDSN